MHGRLENSDRAESPDVAPSGQRAASGGPKHLSSSALLCEWTSRNDLFMQSYEHFLFIGKKRFKSL